MIKFKYEPGKADLQISSFKNQFEIYPSTMIIARTGELRQEAFSFFDERNTLYSENNKYLH